MAKKKASFDSLFSNAKTEEKSKKKNDAPFIELSADVEKNLKNFLKYKKEMKSAETNMRTEESPVIEACIEQLEKDALVGNYQNSYAIKVVIKDEERIVKFITTDKFSFPTDDEMLKQVKEVLADDYEEVTEEVKGLKIKPEVFTDDKLQKELMGLLGDRALEFFTPYKYRILKKGFAEEQYKIAAANDNSEEKLVSIKELIPQAKASLK